MADDNLNNLGDKVTVVRSTFGEDAESPDTRDAIGAVIRKNLNDQGYFYGADDINDSLQDGYDEVCAFTGCVEKAISVPFAANRVYYDFYSIIPDYIGTVAIYNRRVMRWMTPCSARELDQLRENWETSNGEPYHFWPVNYRYVAIFPTLPGDEGDMYVFYKAQAPIMAGSDYPLIPIEIAEEILSSYSTADLMEQAEEFQKAGRYFKGYQEKIVELVRFLRRRDEERFRRLRG